MEIILATNNQNKVREYKRMLEPLGFTIKTQRELGLVSDPEETGKTFSQNAWIKAKALYDVTGLAAVADDSGLAVDVLNGRPGVYSARYAGEKATDQMRNQKLLKELEECQNRDAQFVCAVCYINQQGQAAYAKGVCHGKIGWTPKGENGFGYDPLFLIGDKSFAQLTAEEKDAVSHRGKAMRELVSILKGERNDK